MKRYFGDRCGGRNFYRVRRGKLRCKNCLYEFKSKLGNLRLTRKQWKKIIFWFVLDQPLLSIKEQTGLSYYSVSKAVRLFRLLMHQDVPEVFSGTVEVDETYPCLPAGRLAGRRRTKTRSNSGEKS